MHRFLTISFIALALFISAVGAAPTAHADQACIDNGGEPQVCQCQDAGGVWNNTDGVCSDGSGATIDSSAAKTAIDSNLGKTAEEGFGKVMIWIMSLFAWLVGVAALTLDYAVYYTVVTMGDYVHNLTAVGVAWRIMRDVGNIMLIFGFLAAGISIIINVDLYGWGQKMLPRLLIAAVFLNFSLFISEAVIDTGNLFATQFYTQINGGQVPTSNFLSATTPSTEGISNKIMGQLGLQTIYTAGRVNQAVFKAGNTWIIGFMSIILFMVTAFVMFSLAFVLIARFVTLLFLIIISPVGFASSAVPALAERSKKWWDTLFRQTITAPILLLLLYVALAVITDARFLTGICSPDVAGGGTCTKDWTGFVNGNDYAGFASMMLSFFIAIGLLLYVVYKSKDLGAIGASWATRMAGKLTFGATAWGASALTGGTAFALRRGIVQRFNPTSRFGRGTQRVISRGLRATEGARMDMRAIPGVGSVLGGASAPIQRSTIGRVQQGAEWIRHGGDAANRQMDQETRIPRLTRSIQDGNAQQVGQALGSMSNRELESQPIVRLLTRNPLAAALLPQNRFDALMQSDAISDREKDLLRDARRDDPRFVNAAAAATTIPAMTTDQRSQLNGNTLVLPHVMELLDAPDFAAIQRAGRLDAGQRTAMSLYLQEVATAPVPPDPARQARIAALFAADPRFSSYFGP